MRHAFSRAISRLWWLGIKQMVLDTVSAIVEPTVESQLSMAVSEGICEQVGMGATDRPEAEQPQAALTENRVPRGTWPCVITRGATVSNPPFPPTDHAPTMMRR